MRKHGKKLLVAAVAAALAVTASAAAAPKKTPALVAKGKASYETNCAACHGDGGRGDGVAGAALEPKPRNLVAEPFKRGATVTQVYETLAKGIDGTTMASYAYLPDDERWALAYYVLELRKAKAK
jgi:mono/diheme cytochrome c family protein